MTPTLPISEFARMKASVTSFATGEDAVEWTLQTGFDGDELLMRSGINVITIDAALIQRAEKMIIACEHSEANMGAHFVCYCVGAKTRVAPKQFPYLRI